MNPIKTQPKVKQRVDTNPRVRFAPLVRRWTFDGAHRVFTQEDYDLNNDVIKEDYLGLRDIRQEDVQNQPDLCELKRNLYRKSMTEDLKLSIVNFVAAKGGSALGLIGLPLQSTKADIENCIAQHFRSLPSRYALSVDVDSVVRNLMLMERARLVGSYSLRCLCSHSPSTAVITISCLDRPKIYNRIASALDRVTVNIVEADIMTSTDGMVLDRFVVNLKPAYVDQPNLVESDLLRFLAFESARSASDPPASRGSPSNRNTSQEVSLSADVDTSTPQSSIRIDDGSPVSGQRRQLAMPSANDSSDKNVQTLVSPQSSSLPIGLTSSERMAMEAQRSEAVPETTVPEFNREDTQSAREVGRPSSVKGLLSLRSPSPSKGTSSSPSPSPSSQGFVSLSRASSLLRTVIEKEHFPACPSLSRSNPFIDTSEELVDPRYRRHPFIQLAAGDVVELQEIGRSLSSVAYRGVVRGSGVLVALKKPIRDPQWQPGASGDRTSEDDEMIRREIAIVRDLESHPNICQVVGASLDTFDKFVCYEYLSGGSLWALIHDHSLPPYDYVLCATDIACGMRFLHHHNIIHRDLKSQNVLLDEKGRCKVTDFGLACSTVEGRDLTAETGTYRWMAPEVIRHEPYSTPADVYSFGIVLWELVSREQPYAGMTPIQAAFGVAKDHIRPKIGTNISPRTRALIQRCWHPIPSMRPPFQEITELLPQLR